MISLFQTRQFSRTIFNYQRALSQLDPKYLHSWWNPQFLSLFQQQNLQVLQQSFSQAQRVALEQWLLGLFFGGREPMKSQGIVGSPYFWDVCLGDIKNCIDISSWWLSCDPSRGWSSWSQWVVYFTWKNWDSLQPTKNLGSWLKRGHPYKYYLTASQLGHVGSTQDAEPPHAAENIAATWGPWIFSCLGRWFCQCTWQVLGSVWDVWVAWP